MSEESPIRTTLVSLLLPLLLLLTGCAGTKWEQWDYGPAEYLAETFPSLTDGEGLEIEVGYERLANPTITVHVVDDLAMCGTRANGCYAGNADECDIYIGERASEGTIAHEYRHCYGWSHARAETTNMKTLHWYPTSEKR